MNSFLKSTEATKEKPLKPLNVTEIKIPNSSEFLDLSDDFVTKQRKSEMVEEKPLKSLQIDENQKPKIEINKSEEELLLTNKNINLKTNKDENISEKPLEIPQIIKNQDLKSKNYGTFVKFLRYTDEPTTYKPITYKNQNPETNENIIRNENRFKKPLKSSQITENPVKKPQTPQTFFKIPKSSELFNLPDDILSEEKPLKPVKITNKNQKINENVTEQPLKMLKATQHIKNQESKLKKQNKNQNSKLNKIENLSKSNQTYENHKQYSNKEKTLKATQNVKNQDSKLKEPHYKPNKDFQRKISNENQKSKFNKAEKLSKSNKTNQNQNNQKEVPLQTNQIQNSESQKDKNLLKNSENEEKSLKTPQTQEKRTRKRIPKTKPKKHTELFDIR